MLLSATWLPHSGLFSSTVVRLLAGVQPWLVGSQLQRAAHTGPAGSKQGLSSRSADKQPSSPTIRPTTSQQSVGRRSCAAVGSAEPPHQQPQQLQHQVQLDGPALPGTQLIAAQGDKESYQGPLGGTVIVPKKGTQLWRAAFYGNVPTAWWLDKSSSSKTGASSATCNSTDPHSSSSSSCSISSWSELIARSTYIQQAFRLAGPRSSQFHWQHGVPMLGKQHLLGANRQHRPCPRPCPNRFARASLQERSLGRVSMDPELRVPAAWARLAYLQSRWRGCAVKQIQQRDLQQRYLSRLRSRHRLRSHSWVGAAEARSRHRGWRRVGWHSSCSSSEDSSNSRPQRLVNDEVSQLGDPYNTRREALDSLPLMSSATRCIAERDQHGRVIPLPTGCIGAGTSQKGVSPVVRGGRCPAGRCCDDDEQPKGRTRHWMVRIKEPPAAAAAPAETPAAVAEQLRQQQSLQPDGQQGLHESYVYAADPPRIGHANSQQPPGPSWMPRMPRPGSRQLAGPYGNPGYQFVVSYDPQGLETDSESDIEDHVLSDSGWESDDSGDESDDGSYVDSDYDSDVDEPQGVGFGVVGVLQEVELPDELQAVIAEPHVFRNKHDVIYGFWSKCPLG